MGIYCLHMYTAYSIYQVVRKTLPNSNSTSRRFLLRQIAQAVLNLIPSVYSIILCSYTYMNDGTKNITAITKMYRIQTIRCKVYTGIFLAALRLSEPLVRDQLIIWWRQVSCMKEKTINHSKKVLCQNSYISLLNR